ncbi:MAG TPA: hypothetical protein PLN69_09725 [bacterium]|nr:hypothetical protein [bacterium]
MSTVRVVHTSNINLGRRFPNLESDAEIMRVGDVINVFNQLIDFVIKKKIHIVMIAGGLFDKMHPNRETVSVVLSAFGKIHSALPQTRIVLTPGPEELIIKKGGESDCNLSLFDHLSYVKVIGTNDTPDKVELEFEGQKIVVSSVQSSFFFDSNFKKRRIPAPKERVGLFLLCSYSRRQDLLYIDNELLSSRILQPLKERGYSYVALGQKNKLDLLEVGEFTALYPGSLERFNFDSDRERKCFVVFEIVDGVVQPPDTIRTSARALEYVNLTCSASDKNIEDSLKDLLKRGNREKILYATLNGQLSLEGFNSFKSSEILNELKENFAFVHIDNRLSLVDENEGYNFDALKVRPPIEEFKNYVRKEIDNAKKQKRHDEAKLLEELSLMGIREIEEGL